MKGASPYLVWLLLLATCFTLATVTHPHALALEAAGKSHGVIALLLGDSRRLFANQFFVQADVSFHSGYYPSIFDQAKVPKDSRHMTAREGEPEAEAHEKEMDFLRPPKDWIEKFGRNFLITEHSHLKEGNEREILPWLKISAELDPHKIDTYTVASFWLRTLGKTNEAETFLREGLRNNPNSYEILFELGKLYRENYHDTKRARNVWDEALRKWTEEASAKKDVDLRQLDEIAVALANLEENDGNLPRAIQLFELAARGSPHPEAIRQQIKDLQQKLAGGTNGVSPTGK